jgi:hypothetical protein
LCKLALAQDEKLAPGRITGVMYEKKVYGGKLEK